ncbi:uncharacterized protein LOC105701158 [Orussus abietinus]|uniref:uncharacterized protein LOC105701158 n=1 Tax=Orussus abietinus TaxID=222816 RepID=UPI000625D848|nr:uncharacterized protein LOC105701158 [Orussus abietinus]
MKSGKMYVVTEDENFIPRNFTIFKFYGEDTCFVWNNDKLIIFKYSNNECASNTHVLNVPAVIKNIQCFSERIFINCMPCGIYKLSRNYSFVVLSNAGIGIGSAIHEVLTPKNDHLYLGNKLDRSSKFLFKFTFSKEDPGNLCICSLNADEADERLRGALLDKDCIEENLCLLASDNRLFKMSKETVWLIYCCDYNITDIVPMQQAEKTLGIILLTDTSTVIVMYVKGNELAFEKIHFDTKIQSLCAGFGTLSEDVIWIVYSNDINTYYMKKILNNDLVQKLGKESTSFICLRSYKSKVALGLTAHKEMFEYPVQHLIALEDPKKDDFIELKYEMLEYSDLIVDKICQAAKELKSLNAILQAEQDKLKRINIFAYKHQKRYIPKMQVHRIANQTFLTVKFIDVLPENSQVVVAIKYDFYTRFTIQKVEESEVSVEMPVSDSDLSNSIKIKIDLITFVSDCSPWCLIKDFIKDPLPDNKDKQHLPGNKKRFVSRKLAVLRNLMRDKSLDMKKLSEIKRSIRKEI